MSAEKKPEIEAAAEHFDISDMLITVKMRGKREAIISIKSETNLNAMKYYLGLQHYVEEIEQALGIMSPTGEDH